MRGHAFVPVRIILAAMMSLLVTVATAMPTVATAAAQDSDAIKIEVAQFNLDTTSPSRTQELLEHYISTSNGVPSFDTDRAIQDKASADFLSIGSYFNSYISEHQDTSVRSFPIWGNWCGKGYSGPDAPTDLLDTACMHHDKCYGDPVTPQCDCDQQLINEINAKLNRMHGTERAMVYAVRAAMYVQKAWCAKD